MADPISVAASVIAIVTAAVQSVKSLHETVARLKGRDRTLQRLQNELHDIVSILDPLTEVFQAEASVSAFLQGPIDRCNKACREFEQTMKSFEQNSKAGFCDWAKLEYMKGDINEFIDTISGYKSTFAVGMGIITIRAAKVSQQALDEYNEMIQDTVYDLNVHLQRVDEKLEGCSSPNTSTSRINLDNEKEVTQVCLRICEDAKNSFESLNRRSAVSQNGRNATGDNERDFEAQLLTRQFLDENRVNFENIIGQLQNHLQSLNLNNAPEDEKERLRLLEDINASRQCLEVCKVASETLSQKVYKIGEVIADGDSDQGVVTTLANLFDVKKAMSKDRSAQSIGLMTDAALRDLAEKRYGSRFEAPTPELGSTQTSDRSITIDESRRRSKPPLATGLPL